MTIRIALAGNPNSGKTTMFNDLTGSSQRVGNWPGVTVEKKEGKLKGFDDIVLIDLPGIYSLSPYSPEEIVSRDFLIKDCPDAIINIVDASNLERNLYLTTQLLDIGIPVVVALNMMDVIQKRGDTIDVKGLERDLNCPVIETTALKGMGSRDVAAKAAEIAARGRTTPKKILSARIETPISDIENVLRGSVDDMDLRWYAIKMFERDEMVLEEKTELWKMAEQIVSRAEKESEDDSESIIADGRYGFIGDVVNRTVSRNDPDIITVTKRIDRVVMNRWLALPVFVLIMFSVFFFTVSVVGVAIQGWISNTVFGEWVTPAVKDFLTGAGVADWLVSLITQGIIGGVGAVLGYLPQIFILFVLLDILEDCGYMARVAFLMDKVFRRFGLSGKSLIPILVGTGCSVPAIMAARTIGNENERKMTAITTPFMPCSAKLPVIAMIAGALFGSAWWMAPAAYFLGIVAILVSGLILKKLRMFMGRPSPFIMELPAYHIPHAGSVLKHSWGKIWEFIRRAGTIILLACIIIWFFVSFDSHLVFNGGDVENSMLASFGNLIAPIFGPLGWGDWQSSVATLSGLVSKETIIATFGIIFGANMGSGGTGWSLLAEHYTQLSAFSFLVFNLLCAPCVATIAVLRKELGGWKMAGFALAYQCGFAYAVAMMIFQFGRLVRGDAEIPWLIASFAVLAVLVFLMVRPEPKNKGGKEWTL